MLRLEIEEKDDAEWMAALRMNNTLTEIDLAADLYEMLSTVDNRRTLNHIRCVLACLTIEMMLLYPAEAWKLAMDEYVQKYSMSLWRHLQDKGETWINMKNPQKDQFWEKRLKIMNHMNCFYEMMRRYDRHTLQDCSDIVRILGTVIEEGEKLGPGAEGEDLKEAKEDKKKQELFKQLAERQKRHRDKDAFSQAKDGARLRERRDPKSPHVKDPQARFRAVVKGVQAAQRFGMKVKPKKLGEMQATQMKTAWQAPAGTYLEDSDILAPPEPPGDEEKIAKGEHWKRRKHRLGGGIASFLTFDDSIVAIMDEVFGLQRGADISGTTTDHIAVITLAKDWIEQRRKGSKERPPYEELNQYIALCDKDKLLPQNDAQWNLLQMVPLATMPFAQHHTILEIALPLSFKKINDYRIGYYSTLMPTVCKPGKDKVADNVGRLLTWYEVNRYHAVFVVKPTKEGAPVTRKIGKEKVKGKFGGYEPILAYIMEDDHEKGLLYDKAKALELHKLVKTKKKGGWVMLDLPSELMQDLLSLEEKRGVKWEEKWRKGDLKRVRIGKEFEEEMRSETRLGEKYLQKGYDRKAICRRCGAVTTFSYKDVAAGTPRKCDKCLSAMSKYV